MGLVESDSGRRTMVLSRSIGVRPRDLTLRRYPVPRIVHLDGRDLDTCIKLARWGRRMGAIITFDVGSLRNDVSPIFPFVNHLVVADSFALPFTGTRSARQAVFRLQLLCHGTVVVTQGIRGAIGREEGAFQRQAAFRVRNVDTTGAGDAFHAGYLYGLLHKTSFKRRLELGSAVSALNCTHMGARAGLPTLSAVRKFLERNPPVYA